MKTYLLQQDSLLAMWRALMVRRDLADATFELGPAGDVLVRDEDPWHQIFKTGVFCQLATQLGHRVALRLPIVTRCFGIRVPDVVWMPDEKWPFLRRFHGAAWVMGSRQISQHVRHSSARRPTACSR